MLVLPFTKPNVFIFGCQILYFMEKFAPRVDHFMHNETAQVVSHGAGYRVLQDESAIIEIMVKFCKY